MQLKNGGQKGNFLILQFSYIQEQNNALKQIEEASQQQFQDG